jgi:hypothetical protein
VIVTTEYMVKHWLAEASPVGPWLGRSAIATIKMSLAKLGKSDPRACKNGELQDHGWSPMGNSYATNAEIWAPGNELLLCGDTSGHAQFGERPLPSVIPVIPRKKSGRDLDSPPVRTDTSDTVFMVNGGRWESSQATDPKLKMCLKPA